MSNVCQPDAVVFKLEGVAVARTDAAGSWERLTGRREQRRFMETVSKKQKMLEESNKKLEKEGREAARRAQVATSQVTEKLKTAEELRAVRARARDKVRILIDA